MNIDRKIKQILDSSQQGSLGRFQQLEALARTVAATVAGTKDSAGVMDEAEVIRRIRESERGRREHRLWLTALISACASLVSALAAWTGIVGKKWGWF